MDPAFKRFRAEHCLLYLEYFYHAQLKFIDMIEIHKGC